MEDDSRAPDAQESLHFWLEPDGPEVVTRSEIAVVAGYTGRDRDDVLRHVRELEEQGIAPPPGVPMFYSVPPGLITHGETLVTAEFDTSGEAEVGLIVHDGEEYVTVVSDHTDRAAERLDIPLSKRACHKVIASSVWRLRDVVDHWDTLQLRSWVGDDAADPYQDGLLGSLLAPHELLAAIPWRTAPRTFVLLCGTLPTIGGIRPSSRFRAELYDPVLERRLLVDYRVVVLDFVKPLVTTQAPAGDRLGLGQLARAALEFGADGNRDRSPSHTSHGNVEQRLRPDPGSDT